jgi:hypothetical protein
MDLQNVQITVETKVDAAQLTLTKAEVYLFISSSHSLINTHTPLFNQLISEMTYKLKDWYNNAK